VTSEDLARQLRRDSRFKNAKQIQLLSCQTGLGENSFAQQLADKLGVPVRAPNNYVFFRADGTPCLGDMYPTSAGVKAGTYVPGTSGDWIIFRPRGGK
jgi:hypothetical protein